MTKKKKTIKEPKIIWQVGDGPVHEIPNGATVTFISTEEEFSVDYEEELDVFLINRKK